MARWLPCMLIVCALGCVPAPAAPVTEESASAGEALTSFLVEAHAGRFDVAAASLTLDFVPVAQRPTEGPRLARRLMFLLDRHLVVEPTLPAGPEAAVVTVGALPLGRLKIPVDLVSVRRAGQPGWSFSARTVRSIDTLFAEHGSPLWEVLPQFLLSRTLWVLGAWQWLGLAVLIALAWGLATLALAGLTPLLTRVARLTATTLDDQLVLQLRRPARALLFLLGMAVGTRVLVFPMTAQSLADAATRSAVVAALVWALLVVSEVVAGSLQAGASLDRDANSAGAVKTRVSVLHRLANAVVVVVGVALVLLQFPGVRTLGMSVLASAGVVGVVIGLAAQRTISNLLAGIQISITQPIRIGDTVVIDKQFGVVEEIHLTFVVLKLWDLRRLVVPVSTLLEKPFENWSRSSTAVLGTVELYADCSVDVEAARAELLRVAEASRDTLWDGKKQVLQVTDMSERSVTLRALVSAEDADRLWDLRCVVRENMVAWLRQQPGALPRVRTEAGPVTPAVPAPEERREP